jgi:hypothetical protein
MTALYLTGLGAVLFGAGLITGCYFAARWELDRELRRRELHRRYGSHRRVS